MECEHYMSERYHFGEPRQEATSSIFVLACGFFDAVCPQERLVPKSTKSEDQRRSILLQRPQPTKGRYFSELRCSAASALQNTQECLYTHQGSCPSLLRWNEFGPDKRACQTACQGKSIC